MDARLVAALVESVLALALSVWCFAREERPLLHEAHELGVAPRAAVQGVVAALVLAAIEWGRWIAARCPSAPIPEIGASVGAAALLLPAWVETRARAQGGGWRRDVRAALQVLVAAAAALLAGRYMEQHANNILSNGTFGSALEAIETAVRADARHPAFTVAMILLVALPFVSASLARIHEARPRVVVAAAVATAFAVSALATPVSEIVGGPLLRVEFELALLFAVPHAIAISLGPAFADKLVRKLEKRLPGRHADAH